MNTVCRRRKPADGFTIVELMVVIAIMAIIMVFAIPSYKGLMTQNRMAGEINDLATDIELARSAAVKQGLDVTICPSTTPTATVPTCATTTEWNSGWIAFIDIAGNQTFSATNGDTLLRAHGPFSNTDTLVFSSTEGTQDSITFNRMGGTTSFGTTTDNSDTDTGTLTLHDATNNPTWRRCVILSEDGASTVYSEQSQTYSETSCP
jgi:type IV fimbrial biogenesis protein FimT